MADLNTERKKAVKTGNFMSGVFILTLSAVIVKIIGLVYKIPMLALLGSEGMGYFNSAYEIYTLFCVISTAGLPVAMSVMISSSISKRDGGIKKIFDVSMTLFLILGIIGSAVMLAFALPFSHMLKSEKTVFCILAIAPTVFFICLSSVYRGYFQGLGRMRPTAVSQVIEAVLKLLLGLIFAYIAIRSGFKTEMVAAFAVLGLTLGTAVSALYLALSRKIHIRREKNDIFCSDLAEMSANYSVLPALLKTAIPVTLSSAVISLTKIIDMTVILRRMQDIGYSSPEAFSAYGSYTTLALPLFSLAPALISSISLPLVPALSSAVTSKDKTAQAVVVTDAIKLTAVVSMPISLGLTFFSKEILELIFAGEPEAVSLAAPLLSMLGLSVTLSCLITVGNAVLQAYSKAWVPILSMAVGAVIKVILAYFLIGNKDINIAGAPISTFFCDLTINAINFWFICKYMPEPVSIGRIFVRPFAASFICVGSARLIYSFASDIAGRPKLLTIGAVALAAILYLPVSMAVGAIEKDEILRMPIIGKLLSKKNERKIYIKE